MEAFALPVLREPSSWLKTSKAFFIFKSQLAIISSEDMLIKHLPALASYNFLNILGFKTSPLVTTSTFATFEPELMFPTSGVFRAGLASFTKLFADNYAIDNIRMNNILPGFIDSLPKEKKEGFNFEKFKDRIPLKRYGHVNEISEVVSFLASDGASYITGQNIRVDGGITRSI